MKKRSYLAMIAALGFVAVFSSCKKDYTCVCTNHNTNQTYNIPIENSTQSDAETICNSHEDGTIVTCSL